MNSLWDSVNGTLMFITKPVVSSRQFAYIYTENYIKHYKEVWKYHHYCLKCDVSLKIELEPV